jgi:hypothetical protein
MGQLIINFIGKVLAGRLRLLGLVALWLLGAPLLGHAQSVLLIWDDNNANTQSLKTALQNAGMTVTLSATSETGYTGSNPAPTGFNAVIHLNGTTYATGMPAAGQSALVNYVQAGGGYIGQEWNAYELTAGTMTAMRELIVFNRSNGSQGNLTYDQVAAQATHPILAGLPASFTFSSGYNVGTINTFSTNPCTVLMKQGTNDAVAVRNYGSGRVVGFSHTGNYGSYTTLADANVQQLYINSVRWAGKGISSFSPNPSGVGQPVTITGTNIDGATSLLVNGVNATSTITNNTASSLTFRVPAGTPVTGTTTLVTPTGTVTSAAFSTLPVPGNALTFDGVDDIVSMPQLVTNDFTITYWVRTSMASPTGTQWYQGTGLVDAEVGGATSDFGTALLNGKLAFGLGNPDITIQSNTTINDGRWHHVAVTRNATTGLMQLYIDGVFEKSTTASTAARTAPAGMTLGRLYTGANAPLNGSLDELRFYNAPLSAAAIQADRFTTTSAQPANLVAYYSFDAGTPGGTNTGLTSLYATNVAVGSGTLSNFALTGTASNWTESYAEVVPVNLTATAAGNSNTALNATWTAAALGTVDNYLVDVSTVADFSTVLPTSPYSVPGTTTSLAIGSLTPGTTYYLRVRANKASVAGQGAVSNVVSAATTTSVACAPANNALNFDGADDYMRATGTLPATSQLTLEAWVNPSSLASPTGYNVILNGDDYIGGIVHLQLLNDGRVQLAVGNGGTVNSTFTVPVNTWSHVAVVYSATAGTAKFYLNGTLANTASTALGAGVGSQAYCVGAWLANSTPTRFFKGSINELRVWNVARTDAQIGATYNQALTAQRGLIVGYSFDQGTAGGTNTGTTTAFDNSGNTRNATLTNFALTGATSNWVAGNVFSASTSFTSFSPTSGSPTANITFTGTGFGAVSGVSFNGTPATFTLTNGTTLVAQVPAGATSGQLSITTSCGTIAATGTFTMCTGPSATTQNASVNIGTNGTATVAATSLYTGPAASNCGNFTIGAQKIMTGYVNEGGSITLTAPAGTTFTAVAFASYGSPIANNNGTYSISSTCHASNSQSVVEAAAIGKSTFTIAADNNIFGDPCFGTGKALAIQVSYGSAQPAPQLTFACSETGANPVLLTVSDAYGVNSTAITTVTVSDVLMPGAGSGPLPAAPATALANVPEAANYGILYQLDAPNVASFNGAAIPYGINNSAAAVNTPSRVAYYVELTNGATTKWVWTSMDNFATTLAGLGIPNPVGNNTSLHQNVSNLTVYASANAGLTTGATLGTGRIEMYYSNYAQANSDGVPGADANTYDFGDQPSTGSGYGSFQVHNIAARQTVFAYNNWGVATNNSDIGIGNQVGGSGHPDWTFTYNAGNFSVKRITILVPNVAVFTKPVAVSLPASGTATVAAADILKQAVSDNCSITSMVVTPSTFNCGNLGVNNVTLTLTDASGNTTVGTTTVTVSVPALTSTTWNGSTSTDWSDCRNWSYGQMPTAAISAVLPGNTPNMPLVPTGTALVKDVNISGTNGLNLTSGGTLQVYGSWVNTSSAGNLAGTVAFMGTANQTINQPSATRFGSVMVNKPSGNLNLAQSMGVNTALTLVSGVLTTGSYQAQLSSTATIAETETSYVTGNVAITRTLASSAESFGGLGLTLTPASGSTAPGATAVVRTTGTTLSGNGTSKSIQRYFDIQPATNSGLNIAMTFSYFDHELNAIPKANLVLFKSVSSTNGPWTSMGGTSEVANNRVTKTGLADFSIWTLGNVANPLPVALLDFTAQLQGTAVNLAWHTASEKNSARFDIERSTDGTTFGKLGAVAAQGTTSLAHAYAFRDAQLPLGATTLYYRLRQVDLDGTYTFSPVRIVNVSGAGASAGPLTLFPNPTQGAATLSGAPAQVAVQVFDAVGRVVYTTTTAADGTASLDLPASLPAGVYVVRAGTQAARLTVE